MQHHKLSSMARWEAVTVFDRPSSPYSPNLIPHQQRNTHFSWFSVIPVLKCRNDDPCVNYKSSETDGRVKTETRQFGWSVICRSFLLVAAHLTNVLPPMMHHRHFKTSNQCQDEENGCILKATQGIWSQQEDLIKGGGVQGRVGPLPKLSLLVL